MITVPRRVGRPLDAASLRRHFQRIYRRRQHAAVAASATVTAVTVTASHAVAGGSTWRLVSPSVEIGVLLV